MNYDTISVNGRITQADEGVLPLTSLEVTYGVGVYETVKFRNNTIYFIPQHVNRLLHSASCINLKHDLTSEKITHYLTQYINELGIESCNIKVILQARQSGSTQLYIMATAPHYPKKQWYREGVSVVPFVYERWMPQSKNLNMLPSYYYYQQAKAKGAYDALFIDGEGYVREGSRTNVFLVKGTNIYSPPKQDILQGVTLMSLSRVLQKNNRTITYQCIPFDEIMSYDGMFLTSTSSKVMPVKTIGDRSFPSICKYIYEIRRVYDTALSGCKGRFELL